jgi:hypothetical protein
MASKNPFDATLDVDNQIKVNTFDWTHRNNLTTQIGRITPIFCDLLPAHSTFRVNPVYGLQAMPMVFPIQTPLNARISFFKYPLRALWKDYRDFVGNFRDGLIEPYLNINTVQRLKKMCSTGSLGDYLGLPTNYVGGYGDEVASDSSTSIMYSTSVRMPLPQTGESSWSFIQGLIGQNVNSNYASLAVNTSGTISVNQRMAITRWHKILTDESAVANMHGANFELTIKGVTLSGKLEDYLRKNLICVTLSTNGPATAQIISVYGSYDSSLQITSVEAVGDNGYLIKFTIPNLSINDFNKATLKEAGANMLVMIPYDANVDLPEFAEFASVPWELLTYPGTFDVTELNLTTSPWYNSASDKKNKQIKLSSYAFRAYEGIYNCYYRDNRNNPYYIDGQVQYNQWIPSYDGGEDNNIYELRYANWEKDFLTTAVQSPQQGTAPLVGITTYTETLASEDGTPVEVSKVAIVDEDGKKYGISYNSDETGLNGVEYIELDNGVKMRQARNLIDLATSGISISDLRNVNAYQKFLELNMRKGYSYRDIIEGRFNVKVRYDELLMPEFFGGYSRGMDMNAITQTVDQDVDGSGAYAKALGSQSGLASVRGETDANIECFCDEECIIMGILVVTPVPVYTQLLPKHFTYRGLLDHFQPEFNHIGFQPILYKEVCPIQSYLSNPDSLTETFGYQRPWYEYVQKYDTAHGLFRTNLSNFLMHRVFNYKPELSKQFLTINPDEVTDVFAVTETSDKIYGQIRLECTVKLPISRVAIPRLD